MDKICATCKLQKDSTEFHSNKRNEDGLQYSCKSCRKIYVRNHYVKNRQKYISRSKVSHQTMISKFDELKSEYSCQICGESEPCCIDFHHLDPSEKEFNLGTARGRLSFDKVKSEIQKCIPLCANCHRKLHAGRLALECK